MRRFLPLLLLTVGGCAATIYPAPRPVDPVVFYLADYGIHSSLLLPEPDGRFVEYAFGDWGYSALSHTSPQDILGALLFSHDSALGRRYTTLGLGQIDPLPLNPSPERLLRIYASREDVEKLESELDGRYSRSLSTAVHCVQNGTDYVKDSEHYSLANNCNHMTAASLRKLGCDVKGMVVLPHFRLGGRQEAPVGLAASRWPATMPSAAAN